MCHWIDPSARDSGSWTRTNGDIAFFRSSLCQNRRPAWGKSKWERFIMAFTLFCDGAHAKTGDQVWGNSSEKRFIMAISQQKAAITPKLATRDQFGENRMGNRLSWRFRNKKRESRQNRRIATHLGKFSAESAYHGDRGAKRERFGETFRIDQTIRIDEAMPDAPCRRSNPRQEAPNSGFAVPRSQRPEKPR